MPRHLSYPSITLFRQAVGTVENRCGFHGLARKPKLRFHGTAKLHGVNAGIVLSDEGLHFQSRETILTPEADNAGFARWADTLREEFTALLSPLLADARSKAPADAAPHAVALFGEWFGRGVQKGVGVSSLDKRFAAFGLAAVHDGMVRDHGEDVVGEIRSWTPHKELPGALAPMISTGAILCVENFQTWDIEIDFEDLAASQARLDELVAQVERDCPVAKALGAPGGGEGIVWICQSSREAAGFEVDDLWFKVKGAKHSESAAKSRAPIDIEKVASIQACAALAATPNRFEKGLDHLRAAFPGTDPLDSSKMGAFIKWTTQDVAKEEADTIAGNGLDPKEVGKAVGALARAWFAGRQAEEREA